MTYRERREARAERLRGWAEERERKAAAVLKAGEPFRGDIAFNTQPGHMPFREKLIAREDRAHESLGKARGMVGRAAGIEQQLDTSIYSDDPDAVEALTARITELEAKRDRIKAFNATCRKGQRDLTILNEAEQADLLGIMRVAMFQIGKGGAMPGYVLTNLSGNLKRYKDRLKALTGPKATTLRYYYAAKYGGTCEICNEPVAKGSPMYYDRADQTVRHEACFTAKAAEVKALQATEAEQIAEYGAADFETVTRPLQEAREAVGVRMQ